jgi:ribosome-associated protein
MSTLFINADLQIPISEFTFVAVRSQGPGGQNVNKVNSKVSLQWELEQSSALPEPVRARLRERARSYINKSGALTISSQRSRHRQLNRDECLRKLRVLILDAARPPKLRTPTKPTRSSIERRRRDKNRTALKKKQRAAPNIHD